MEIKRLFNIILYVPEGPLGKIFKRAKTTTTTVLFIPNDLGIKSIPWGPSPFVY